MDCKRQSPSIMDYAAERHTHSVTPGYPSPASSASSTFNCIASESLSHYNNNYSSSLIVSQPGSSAVSPAPIFAEPWSSAPMHSNTLAPINRADGLPISFLPSVTGPDSGMPWAVSAYSTPSGMISGGAIAPSHLYSPDSSLNGCEPHTPIKDESDWIDRSPMLSDDMSVSMKREDSMTVSPQHLSHVHPMDYNYNSPLSHADEALLRSNVGLGIHSMHMDDRSTEHYRMHADRDESRAPRRLSEGRPNSAIRRKRTNRNRSATETAATCEICGRGFQREYNRKTHMDTHNPQRQKAHICTWDNCGRSFVRRTDLNRHQESVHIKARPFGCELCNARFSRRDTLQRHVEDGCPRRFDVDAQESYDRRMVPRHFIH